jgi:galactoside O-acetyltransferase
MSTRFQPGYWTEDDLRDEGFAALGRNVRIATNCTIAGLNHISIGDNVRIDGYCTLIASDSGCIDLGSYIHIGSYCHLSGGAGIVLEDFTGLSQGVRIYSRSDDYSGEFLTNPMVPPQFTNPVNGRVTLQRHVIVGSGSVILPGVSIGAGASVGALSLVTKDLDAWSIYFGAPARRIGARSQRLLELEQRMMSDRMQIRAA